MGSQREVPGSKSNEGKRMQECIGIKHHGFYLPSYPVSASSSLSATVVQWHLNIC